MPLTNEQQQAVAMAMQHDISVLHGAPGVGKTYTLRTILDVELQSGTVSQAAPTGKAAQQMQTATGYPASTIHRLLEPEFVRGQFQFRRNASSPISAKTLILDECSMITNSLMASLLRAVDLNQTKLIMTGDNYQLPAVGAGAVFRDVIASGMVPSTELTEIQRNSGDIVRACHKIKDGRIYEPSAKLVPQEGLNLRHVEITAQKSIQDAIKKIVCQRMPERGYDPVWDVQVLSPTNKKTDLSCDALNLLLQAELNPNPPEDETQFRTGDKIIQIKNAKLKDNFGRDVLVVNGDMGKVSGFRNNNILIDFLNPPRSVVVNKKINDLLLAYAITVHRFQGSQAPVIIVPVHSAFRFFCDRCWIYTAISRAQDLCITVGEFGAVRQAIKHVTALNRITMLVEKLRAGGTI